jgi:TolB protein
MSRMRTMSSTIAIWAALGCLCSGAWAKDRIAYLSPDAGYWQVWVAESNGANAKRVSSSAYDKVKLSWYPGGDKLLVCGSAGELVTLSVADGGEQEVSLPIEHGGDAVLSPDGATIALSAMNASSPDTNDIWLAQVDGSRARKIASMPALQHEPAWTASGNALYFLSGPGGQAHDIYSVDSEGKQLEQLTVGKLYHFDLSVAPDGMLAFSSNRRQGNYDIWTRDRAGKERLLVAGEEMESQPAWSADGRSLYFTRTQGAVANIWLADRSGKRVRKITTHAKGARGVAVSSSRNKNRGKE